MTGFGNSYLMPRRERGTKIAIPTPEEPRHMTSEPAEAPTKQRELTVFLFLALVLAPILAVIIVAGYGFMVWMYQIVMGPPSV